MYKNGTLARVIGSETSGGDHVVEIMLNHREREREREAKKLCRYIPPDFYEDEL